ncbi:MAG: bifunctional 3-deoxy-7-phosphoheptulonate synthase/chorismate mutase [Candidatus Carbobacillus altaicus]|nr:bifunctional 3-deoxy-7-phosphoheptulonate synthase/chorismate mutase [Candidatus Carbobacillus altaicus]
MSESLEALRAQLDAINEDILHALNRRARIVEEIGRLKLKQGINRFDPVRERAMLDHLVSINEGPFDDQTIRSLFKQIFAASLQLQKKQHEQALLVSRARKPENTVVYVGDVAVGGEHPVIIAGPCSVESEAQTAQVAEVVAGLGLKFLRGGAFKPRTSPYDFQGLGLEGLKILREVANRYDLRVVSEIMTPGDLEVAADYVDVIQIGARNMQNFNLLKAVGALDKPVLLKRGMAATIEEFKFAAEYILSHGNPNVILTERGIRTYEKATRNTLDISAVPILKQETHLPVLVDVTHAAGRRDILLPLAKAALAAGADGVMIEVHPDPNTALSDAQQQIDLDQFRMFYQELTKNVPVFI